MANQLTAGPRTLDPVLSTNTSKISGIIIIMYALFTCTFNARHDAEQPKTTIKESVSI